MSQAGWPIINRIICRLLQSICVYGGGVHEQTVISDYCSSPSKVCSIWCQCVGGLVLQSTENGSESRRGDASNLSFSLPRSEWSCSSSRSSMMMHPIQTGFAKSQLGGQTRRYMTESR